MASPADNGRVAERVGLSRIMAGDFTPPPWLRNRHLQTLLANQPFHSPQGPGIVDDRLNLPDGDVVRLVRLTPPDVAHNDPLVVVLHGLAGGYDSAYARDLFSALLACGLEAHMLHFRGCGGVANRLPRGYHAGDTADLDFYLHRLRARYPHRPLVAVGYSLGANVLLKHLGEASDTTPLSGAVAVSVPFDLQDACDSISVGFSNVYQKVLLKRLKDAMWEKFGGAGAPGQQPGAAPFDLAALRQVRTLEAFDDLVTAPMHGFRDAATYYRRSSCRQFLPAIRTPTLIVHAQDDPFQSARGIPRAHELPDCVTLELPRHGGHVGFLGSDGMQPVGRRRPFWPRAWLPGRICDWLTRQLDWRPSGSLPTVGEEAAC